MEAWEEDAWGMDELVDGLFQLYPGVGMRGGSVRRGGVWRGVSCAWLKVRV
jgi:hypothetical protein